jgi:hypothetical protein
VARFIWEVPVFTAFATVIRLERALVERKSPPNRSTSSSLPVGENYWSGAGTAVYLTGAVPLSLLPPVRLALARVRGSAGRATQPNPNNSALGLGTWSHRPTLALGFSPAARPDSLPLVTRHEAARHSTLSIFDTLDTRHDTCAGPEMNDQSQIGKVPGGSIVIRVTCKIIPKWPSVRAANPIEIPKHHLSKDAQPWL